MNTLASIEAIETAIKNGEGQTVEFKSAIPDVPRLSRLVASMANRDGGLIVIGIDDRGVPANDIKPSPLQRTLESAIAEIVPTPIATAHIVRYRERDLGVIVVEVPDLSPPLYRTRGSGDVWIRLGARTAPAAPGEMRPRPPPTGSVKLNISAGQLDRFFKEADEDAFTDLLVVPLLRTLGFHGVQRKGHSDKSLEFGQDLRGIKYRMPTGHTIYLAAQIKAGAIGYSPAHAQSIDRILEQLRMAMNKKMMDWQLRTEHRPDHVILAASGVITEGARIYLTEQICDDQMKIWFWDKDAIAEACQVQGLPNEIQNDILNYLNAPSES